MRPNTVSRHQVVLAAVLGSCLVVALAVAVVITRRSPPTCRVTAAASPTCGAWWGTALPDRQSQLVSAVARREQASGRGLDIVHTYHRFFDSFPTATETQLAKSGHLLLLNWEPTTRTGAAMSWSSIAAGRFDAAIDAEAGRLRALGMTALVSFSHEPELNYGSHGTATDFAAAFRHVVSRTRRDGAANVRWVWDLMGLADPVWHARYLQMWPGQTYVDWIGWDPYNFASCRGKPWQSFADLITPFYSWLNANGFGTTPFMLAEYGTVERPGDPTAKAAWLAAIPDAMRALPRLHALVYFDVGTPPANCNWQATTSAQASLAFAGLSHSSIFTPWHTVRPGSSG